MKVANITILGFASMLFCGSLCAQKEETIEISTKDKSKLKSYKCVVDKQKRTIQMEPLKSTDAAMANQKGMYSTGIAYSKFGLGDKQDTAKILMFLATINKQRYADMCNDKLFDPKVPAANIVVHLKPKFIAVDKSGKIEFSVEVSFQFGQTSLTGGVKPELWEFENGTLRRTRRAGNWWSAGL